MVSKGPVRDKKHLDRVRSQVCIVCRALNIAMRPPSQAHHIREMYPRTLGKRIGDDKTVPLCAFHHAAVHSMSGQEYWKSVGLDPIKWCEEFCHASDQVSG